jgi:hypothetical protein
MELREIVFISDSSAGHRLGWFALQHRAIALAYGLPDFAARTRCYLDTHCLASEEVRSLAEAWGWRLPSLSY